MYQDFKTKNIFLFSSFVITFIFYLVFRFLILFYYSDVFVTLTGTDIVLSFLYGIRFDLSIISLLYMPLFFLFLLPVKSKKYIDTLLLFILIIFLLQIIILISDFMYFPESKRHIADELADIWTERMYILSYIMDKMLLLTMLTISFFVFICYLIIKRFNKIIKYKNTSLIKNIVVILIIISAMFLMFRGRITGKPLNITDIYKMSNNMEQATLSLNPVFTSVHTLRKKGTSFENKYPLDEAFKNTQELLLSKDEKLTDSKYPLIRQIENSEKEKNYNIFIVLMESWSPKYIDGYSHNNYGVTPNMDEIISQSVVFTNAYAAGIRSIYGISAAFAGISLVPGLQHFAYGLELNNIFSIADIFPKDVYYTAFMQSSKRESYQLCDIAKNIFHVDESFGREDMPNLMNYTGKHHFGYDYDLLMFAADKATEKFKQKKNFFIFTFTGTTHTPFNSTVSEFDKYPRTTDENKYLNTLYYSDYSVGKLIENSKKEGWFDNTIFIFLADHNLNTIVKTDNLKEKFNIPFIIYAPKIFESKKIDYVVSQLDIIPTLCHILNIKEPFVALGKNALDENTEHFALVTEGTNLAIIYDNFYMKHNRQKVLETNATEGSKEYKKLESSILSLDKSITESFKHNIWYK